MRIEETTTPSTVSIDAPNRRILLLLLLVTLWISGASSFEIGHGSIVLMDPSRNDRQILTELYYPALTAGENVPVAEPPAGGFPVLSFGHGFLLPWDVYEFLWMGLVPEAYIVALPRTEGGILPDHLEFARDLAFVVSALQAAGNDPDSPFHGKVGETSAVMGHSMGGGASILAAAEDAGINAVANLAAAETQPSAIAAAGSITARALLLAGSLDCVSPPPQHQLPIYQALASDCKSYVELIGASHCQFAAYNFTCSLGELACQSPTLTRSEQHDLTLSLLIPWLAFALRDDLDAYNAFNELLVASDAWNWQQECEATQAPWFDQAGTRSIIEILAAPALVSDTARIEFAMSEGARIEAWIYDIAGRAARDFGGTWREAGRHELIWDGRDDAGRRLSAGVYLLRLSTDRHAVAGKLLILR